VPSDVRRSADRFTTERPGSSSRYCFSFGHHYDPDNTAFGPVVAVNDEQVEAGAGFDEHTHGGVVIVTYVVSGSLVHQGIARHELQAGEVAVFRPGASSTHSEHALDGPVRFVQTWIASADPTVAYDVVQGSVVVDGVTVVAGRLPAQTVSGHLFVATGSVRVGDLLLEEGDSLRTTEPVAMEPKEGSELVIVLTP
jgi:redox-sensitive bicupin YhaK (pirin superfamily)